MYENWVNFTFEWYSLFCACVYAEEQYLINSFSFDETEAAKYSYAYVAEISHLMTLKPIGIESIVFMITPKPDKGARARSASSTEST